MTREWSLVVRCDVCHEEADPDNAVFFAVAPNRMPDRTADLCHMHLASLDWVLDVTRPIVTAEKADRPPLAKRGRDAVSCPFCNEVYTAGSGVAIHVKMKHPIYYRAKTDWSRITFDGKQMVG